MSIWPESSLQGSKLDTDLFAMAAFRYALGRSTYIVGHVAEMLENNASAISEKYRRLIVQEIQEADENGWLGGSLGSPYDLEVWRQLKKVFEATLKDERKEKQ